MFPAAVAVSGSATRTPVALKATVGKYSERASRIWSAAASARCCAASMRGWLARAMASACARVRDCAGMAGETAALTSQAKTDLLQPARSPCTAPAEMPHYEITCSERCDIPEDIGRMRFHQPIRHHRQQLVENGVHFGLLLDKVDDDGKMQPLYVASAAGVQLPMSSIAGIGLNRGGALNSMLPQEGENIVRKKAVRRRLCRDSDGSSP